MFLFRFLKQTFGIGNTGEAQNKAVKAALLMLLAGEAGAAVSNPFIHTRKQGKPPQRKALVLLQKPSLEGRMGFGGDSQGQSSASAWGSRLEPALGAEIQPSKDAQAQGV